MISSKSPRKVARVALAAGREAFSDYSSPFSPQKFTQPQLFACLVLKEFEKKDYRGMWELLKEFAGLRQEIGLKSVPHFTTLQKASVRLLTKPKVRLLIDDTVRRINRKRRHVKYGAADSSGFDAHHASRYFIFRTSANQKGKEPKKRRIYKKYGKLMTVIDTATHAILSAVASAGPTPDIDQLEGVMDELPRSITMHHLVADAGFDSAYNHWLLRDFHGMRSTIPPEHGRPPKDPGTLPKDQYRRRMKTHFNRKAYRHRPQIETVFSMMKRNFGAALRAKSHYGRCRDMLLKAVTHNVALALVWVFYRAGRGPFSFAIFRNCLPSYTDFARRAVLEEVIACTGHGWPRAQTV